jgi:uncharacterized protein YozE (UPF0346 family)
MSKIGFTTWLLQQSKRDDPVGDLSRDANADSRCPHGNADIQIWHSYLVGRNAAQEVLDTLKSAWREYKAISHLDAPG